MAQDTAGRSNRNGLTLLIVGAFIASAAPFALCKTNSVQPPAVVAPIPQQMPAYEVATIKPAEANGPGMPLRVYIQGAFGIPVNSTGWVIGPDWIDSAKYVIQGKPAESIQTAMQAMTPAERVKQNQLMKQGLLADRFQLKAHFETREMPLYRLIIAKGGAKLKESTGSTPGQVSVSTSIIRGKAAPIHNLLDMLESVPDIGGRVVIDETGLSGTYDFLLKWSPLEATPTSGAEGVSLFTAIEEQLGLKLVPARGPGQVLVIDHIERPSEN